MLPFGVTEISFLRIAAATPMITLRDRFCSASGDLGHSGCPERVRTAPGGLPEGNPTAPRACLKATSESGGEPYGAPPRSPIQDAKGEGSYPAASAAHMRIGAIVTHEPQTDSLATRRGVLAGVGLVGIASAITACGSGGSSSSSSAAAGNAARSTS